MIDDLYVIVIIAPRAWEIGTGRKIIPRPHPEVECIGTSVDSMLARARVRILDTSKLMPDPSKCTHLRWRQSNPQDRKKRNCKRLEVILTDRFM